MDDYIIPGRPRRGILRSEDEPSEPVLTSFFMHHELDDIPPATDPEPRTHHFRIGGKTTWRIKLDTSSVVRPEQPSFVVEEARFELTEPKHWSISSFRSFSEFGDTTHYKVGCRIFHGHAFRWKYLVDKKRPSFSMMHAGQRLILAQIFKLSQEIRASLANAVNAAHLTQVHFTMTDFDKPKNWWRVHSFSSSTMYVQLTVYRVLTQVAVRIHRNVGRLWQWPSLDIEHQLANRNFRDYYDDDMPGMLANALPVPAVSDGGPLYRGLTA